MSIRTLFENIADAIKEKDESITTLTPTEMPDAILNLPSGGNLYTNYTTQNERSNYSCDISRTLICTISGRHFYKTTNDPAYICYGKQGSYSGPFLISKIANGVQYTVETSPTFSTSANFTYNGETWYISNNSYFFSGDQTSTDGVALKFSFTQGTREGMGQEFLDFVLNLPDEVLDVYKTSNHGVIKIPEGYDGFGNLFIL